MTRSIAAIALLLMTSPAWAVGTSWWEDTSREEFAAGQGEEVVISSEGEIAIGRKSSRVAIPEGTVWCSVTASWGVTYLGTGTRGLLYKLVERSPQPIHETGELLITCFAQVGDRLLFGTIPNGKIYALGADEKVNLFCDLPAPYVWRLAVSADGFVLAATGDRGRVYRIGPDGRDASVAWQLPERNAIALLTGPGGAVYLGGAEKGLLYAAAEAGRVRVLADLGGEEVRDLAFAPGGEILAAVNGSKGNPPAPAPGKRARPFSEILAKGAAREGARRPLSGALSRVSPETGRIVRLAASDEDYFLQVVPSGEEIFVATGGQGRILRVMPDRVLATVFDFEEEAAQTVAIKDGALWFVGAGNAAALHFMEEAGSDGLYLSGVKDARFPARFGVLEVEGTGALIAQTRSGNTPTPDDTWSPWSEDLAAFPASIPSPPGRYFQYRIAWSPDKSAVLTRVAASYAVHNQAPEVTRVTVERVPGREVAPGLTANATARKIVWESASPDGDPLAFHLYFRGESEPNWKRITLKGEVSGNSLNWETESLPNGRYLIRVEATDARANAPGEGLVHALASRPFLIDNQEPTVSELAATAAGPGRWEVRGIARDAAGPLTRVEYALDGGEWVGFNPEDGIADEREEGFAMVLDGVEPGSHSLTVRAFDSDGNIGSALVILK